MRRLGAVIVLGCACADPPPPAPVSSAVPDSTGHYGTGNSGGAAGAILEAPVALITTVTNEAHDARRESRRWFAADVHIESDHVRWRRCDDAWQCSTDTESAPIADFLGVDAVADAPPNLKQIRFRAGSPTQKRLEFLASRGR